MTGLVSWCTERARMILAFVLISIGAGLVSYVSLPKEGAPNIDVPVLYISVPFPGVSAIDSERLVVKPLETELRGLDGLKDMTGIASDSHAAVLLEFDQGWDKQATLAEVRDKVDQAQAEFPEDADEPTINEINLSEFPILVVSLSGLVPERTLTNLAKDMQDAIEAHPSVLEAKLTGHRDEMVEVLIDPLKMESYNVTAQELLTVVDRNNQLVAAGAVESETAAFSVKVPGSFETASDINNLPVKVNGDRVIRLGDVTEIRRTFEDAEGEARYNGRKSISLQVSKRIGQNIIATVAASRAIVEVEVAKWPEPLQQAVNVDFSMDESTRVEDMVSQLEGSVATAVILVMLVVLASLGFRSALLVGIAIPSSFLLSFALMSAFELPINNMVMFGLILAVGMLVDGAIVVVEYADKEIQAGQGPMRAYAAAAKRMFWPITASTATTLCAFLPMLLWPGMPGQFMRQLPITLIFVLSASLIVALIFLPVLGGISGRISRAFARAGDAITQGLRGVIPRWVTTTAKVIAGIVLVAIGIFVALVADEGRPEALPLIFIVLAIISLCAVLLLRKPRPAPEPGYHRTPFGRVVGLITLNPVMPFVAVGAAVGALVLMFQVYAEYGKGTEFFVKTEPERAIIYVRARGNLSLNETDRMVKAVEDRIAGIEGIESIFAFSGGGGLVNPTGQEGPPDAIGQVQVELKPWGERGPGDDIIIAIGEAVQNMPGIVAELALQQEGPQQGKPVQLELSSGNWDLLLEATEIARAKFDATEGLVNIDDSRPLPGIDWEITVDRAVAGRYGADVATVGPLVQLVTRGAILGTYRPDDSDDELEIRMRFPESDRTLSTLDQLKVATDRGQVPLSNFIERQPVPKLENINRIGGERFFTVRSDVAAGTSDIAAIEGLEAWIAEETPFPPGVSARFTGDREEQQESMAFLAKAFAGALGLMFVILLAQFNSLYNSVLVLSAVVMSVGGVLVGMLIMGQNFSIIMTGTGIVALAGIVVNNNIVLIDTYQELARRMDPLEAVVRTAEARIRPVMLTTITTIAGLTPMMFATSLDFANGTIAVGAPTALWWVQLATAVVFGLATATVLTLVVTPAALAARIWIERGALAGLKGIGHAVMGKKPAAETPKDDTSPWNTPTPETDKYVPSIVRAAE
ncbi:MAG: efflux RND transporter permease subunit [Pseudomonadota bacterium]